MDSITIAGVDSKGYGKVYKRAMKDSSLPLTAKGLLAYLCAYAGNGTSAFPKREKMLRDMKLGKDTFTKHMAALESAGYIARHRTVSGTVYEIFTSVTGDNGERIELKKTGYGTIPKLVVLDIRLSVKAKAVYAYMCSYAGAGHSAYPHVGTILRDLKITKNSYYSYYNELVGLGYISVEQRVDESGRFDAATYKLNEFVDIEGALLYRRKSAKTARTKSVPESSNEKKGEDIIPKSVENSVEYPVESTGVQNVMSENLVSEKPVSQNFGHANINNNLTTNSSLSSDKERKKNNILLLGAEGDVENCPNLTRSGIREWIRYQEIIAECVAWAGLKETLKHFSSSDGKQTYIRQCKAVADEMVYQIQRLFFRKMKYSLCDNKKYENASLRKQLTLQREKLKRICIEVADASDRIRSLRHYMQTVIMNLATQKSDSGIHT